MKPIQRNINNSKIRPLSGLELECVYGGLYNITKSEDVSYRVTKSGDVNSELLTHSIVEVVTGGLLVVTGLAFTCFSIKIRSAMRQYIFEHKAVSLVVNA